ncbi:hypothetical protein [uncultured Campylobacter sp.]|uniref:hypothetical protein n=1 Tax=uncultured Campylobacter sp. TaxID=218934 RepID=UPI00263236FC|nr:hypothetical protein [uncultured Campylobacter sp.]
MSGLLFAPFLPNLAFYDLLGVNFDSFSVKFESKFIRPTFLRRKTQIYQPRFYRFWA